jgi:hypothetical protein
MKLRSLFVVALTIGLAGALPLIAAERPCGHTTYADVVALDQAFYNNRIGAFQAGGMVFALRRDVVSNETGAPDPGKPLNPGLVMVRPDKRPRPIVLRVNVGDCLEVSFQNLLAPQPMIYEPLYNPPRKTAPPNTASTPYVANDNLMVKAYAPQDNPPQNYYGDGKSQPATRWAGVHVMGMELVEARDEKGVIPTGSGDGAISADGSFNGANGVFTGNAQRLSGLVAPGARITYVLYAPAEGSYLLYSTGATNGSAGSLAQETPGVGGPFGGQLSQGLFGSVTVQPKSAEWYRSQVTHEDLQAATRRITRETSLEPLSNRVPLYGQNFPRYRDTQSGVEVIVWDRFDRAIPADIGGYLHLVTGQPYLDYQAKRADGTPILRMTMVGANGHEEIVYSDLTAIITGPKAGKFPTTPPGSKFIYPDNNEPFREFAIHYHDDFVTTQAFPQFNTGSIAPTLQAGRDFFAINYGMGGIGAEILANRFGVGPMWSCATCKFEEFFLSSWTDGDPAQVVDFPANSQVCTAIPKVAARFSVTEPLATCALQLGPKATKVFYPDDPSNVYHSYLKDHVKIQILHAGTNITHVHHLHAQQWLHTPKSGDSHYRDSQMISPGGSFTLDHVHNGSGNLNLTVGDSIFHCHFYPHFAQGMWSLWRTHDVFEPGTTLDDNGRPTGTWNRALPDGEIPGGSPTPGLVPLPQIAMAPMPARVRIVPVTIDPPAGTSTSGSGPITVGYMTEVNPQDKALNPGFPFFVPGVAGQRAPHPPLDFAPDETKPGTYLDGGLPRAITLHDAHPYEQHTRWDFTKINNSLTAVEIPEEGTATEIAAMTMHSVRNHPSSTPEGTPAPFRLNGQPAVPGAPYANPNVDENGKSVCDETTPGKDLAPESGNQPCLIRYKAADVQIDAVVNKVGWHYPQTRMISLWDDVNPTVHGKKPPEPFFFRANSHQVIEYWLANLVPAFYELDDFQVRTPTDIIGQHIHLVKFDVTSSDGAANGYNYEDGTLSPEEVRDLIKAINTTKGIFTTITPADGVMKVGGPQKTLTPKNIPFFKDGPDEGSKEWVGAQATIQRWYADPQLNNEGQDRTLRTVFTHDHFGPSTHQQTGLYAGLLVEPDRSFWVDPVTGKRYGSNLDRASMDGGPTGWQAVITTTKDKKDSYREFALEFQDRQLGYKANSRTSPSPYVPGHTGTYTGWSQPSMAINPATAAGATGPAPFPQIVTGTFNVGTWSLSYRNEPIPFRVAPGAAPNASDLSFAFASMTRNYAPINTQPIGPVVTPNTGEVRNYPGPFPGAQPTDPYTPLLRGYEGDRTQMRILVGAHMAPHFFKVHGVQWLFEPEEWDCPTPSSCTSGYRGAQGMGISEHYEFLFDMPKTGTSTQADYFYSSTSDANGLQAGNWGLMRAYSNSTTLANLARLPNNPQAPAAAFDCTRRGDIPQRSFNVTAAQVSMLTNGGALYYNRRGQAGAAGGQKLAVPGAIVYVQDGKLPAYDFDKNGNLRKDAVIEPLVLRANAGDCITIKLTNALSPATLPAGTIAPTIYTLPFTVASTSTTLAAAQAALNAGSYTAAFGTNFNTNPFGYALPAQTSTTNPPATVKGVTVTGSGTGPWTITSNNTGSSAFTVTMNSNGATFPVSVNIPMATSSTAGLHAQVVTTNITTSDGDNVGLNPTQTVPAGSSATTPYVWYAGKLDAAGNPFPVEFGSVNLTPSDPVIQGLYGLIGALVIEPKGTEWTVDSNSNASAIVRTKNTTKPVFREFVTVVQDGLLGVNQTQPGSTPSPAIQVWATNSPNISWATGPADPNSQISSPNNAKYIVRPGEILTFAIQNNPDGVGNHGLAFLDKTTAQKYLDFYQPEQAFSTPAPNGFGPSSYGTKPVQCPGTKLATLRAKPTTAPDVPVNFQCTIHKANMAGSIVVTNDKPDVLIEGGIVPNGSNAQSSSMDWILNGTAMPNNSNYVLAPGQLVQFRVHSGKHGLTFLADQATVAQVFDIKTATTQALSSSPNGIPAPSYGTAGFGPGMVLVTMRVKNQTAITSMPFECTIHQSNMAGVFKIQTGATPPVMTTQISANDVNGAQVHAWDLNYNIMPNDSMYFVRNGDTINFENLVGFHGIALLVDRARAESIFDFVSTPQMLSASPGNVPKTQPSWGTGGFNAANGIVQLLTLRVKPGTKPQVVPFECSIHLSGMFGYIVINGGGDELPAVMTPSTAKYTGGFNYRMEPLGYRFADPNWLENFYACNESTLGITRANSNTLVLADPQTPVFTASAGTPVRFRMLHPGGLNEQVLTLHGHNWQEEPFTPGSHSTEQGKSATSNALGSRDSFGPNMSWDLLVDSAGGPARVPGDYLFRTFIGTDFMNGMWGLFRVSDPDKEAVVVTNFPKPGEMNLPADGAMIEGVNSVDPNTGKMATYNEITGSGFSQKADVDPLTGAWKLKNQSLKPPVKVTAFHCAGTNCTPLGSIDAPGYIPVILQNAFAIPNLPAGGMLVQSVPIDTHEVDRFRSTGLETATHTDEPVTPLAAPPAEQPPSQTPAPPMDMSSGHGGHE